MTRRGIVGGMLLVAAGAATSSDAAAHGWGRYGYYGPRVGIGITVPLGGYGYYPGVVGVPIYRPAYVVPPAVVVNPPTTVYVERGSPGSTASDAGSYWYYCRKPKGYYPYVKRCPDGWERVAPEPYDR